MNMIDRAAMAQTAAILQRDPAYIDGLKDAMLETGLADLLGFRVDESKLDPCRPMPTDWTAIQVAYFDNGERKPGRKRPKLQRTTMRWGGNVRVWTGANVNFRRKPDWQANIYLWTADEAREIVRDLKAEKYVGQETVDLLDSTIMDSADLRYSIPLLRLSGTSTRWMKGHVVMTNVEGGLPCRVGVTTPTDTIVSGEPFDEFLADGSKLTGSAVRQCRIGRDESLQAWATEIAS